MDLNAFTVVGECFGERGEQMSRSESDRKKEVKLDVNHN
jgi:hypothetical protein